MPIDWAWAEDSADILKIRRSGRVNFWRGGPKISDPPPSPVRPIHISIESSRQEDSEYIIFNRFDTCRPKVMLTGASCTYPTISAPSIRAKTVAHCSGSLWKPACQSLVSRFLLQCLHMYAHLHSYDRYLPGRQGQCPTCWQADSVLQLMYDYFVGIHSRVAQVVWCHADSM